MGLIIATNNFDFEVKAILGLESTHLESRVAKIGLNGPAVAEESLPCGFQKEDIIEDIPLKEDNCTPMGNDANELVPSEAVVNEEFLMHRDTSTEVRKKSANQLAHMEMREPENALSRLKALTLHLDTLAEPIYRVR